MWGRWIAVPVCMALVVAGGCSTGSRERLVDRAVPAPALVYGRPLVLAPGLRLSGTALSDQLRTAGYRRTEGAVTAGTWKRQGARFDIERRPFHDPDGFDPGGFVRVELASDGRDIRVDRLEDGQGDSIREVFLAPPVLGSLDDEGGDPGVRVPLERFPEHVLAAVLLTEDRRFRRHPGIDPIRIVGAWLENRRAGRIVEGASTITQQFAKNAYLTPERTWSRKFKEVALSFWLELRYS
ncbi:MAG: transglycosylase domain-containing protein, partial [Myxococcales bacterium]|nr:transglycosylase domain-containing protein [Myxococcales bacterium]